MGFKKRKAKSGKRKDGSDRTDEDEERLQEFVKVKVTLLRC